MGVAWNAYKEETEDFDLMTYGVSHLIFWNIETVRNNASGRSTSEQCVKSSS